MSGPSPAIVDTARRWLEAEPDDDIRAELSELIDRGDPSLEERFSGRLQFGTAGLRAAVGAGSMRMNRLVVRQAAAGLARHLLATDPRVRERGILVAGDARRKSDLFVLDTARVFAALGVPVRLFDEVVPTPVLAWSITGLDASAGVMVTASHNPPADNGYKVYLDSGAQIVPPHDEAISAAEAGAAILHLHARNPETGKPDQTPEGFKPFLPRIKESTNAVLNITTGGSPYMTVQERALPAATFQPEVASLNMGSYLAAKA